MLERGLAKVQCVALRHALDHNPVTALRLRADPAAAAGRMGKRSAGFLSLSRRLSPLNQVVLHELLCGMTSG